MFFLIVVYRFAIHAKLTEPDGKQQPACQQTF